MTEQVPSRMQVVRKQDKEPRLKEFIHTELSLLARDEDGGDHCCLVVARSLDSPVIRALSGLTPELAQHVTSVRVILSSVDSEQSKVTAVGDWLAAAQARWMRNTRLADAHEFLVIGHQASWIGDSMRRDPSKRDAFEGFRSKDAVAARDTVRSFERLWRLSEALPRASARPAAMPAEVAAVLPSTQAAGDVAAAAAQDAQQAPVPGATRH